MKNIKEKVINFIIENEDEILFLGACILVGGVTAIGSYYLTNKGYVAGYKDGYNKCVNSHDIFTI